MIERIEAAETKDDLLAIADEMSVTGINKRMGIETIRAELVEAAEETGTPEAEVQTAKPEPEAKPKQRMLKHRKSGRLLPWTAALAKKREMQEV